MLSGPSFLCLALPVFLVTEVVLHQNPFVFAEEQLCADISGVWEITDAEWIGDALETEDPCRDKIGANALIIQAGCTAIGWNTEVSDMPFSSFLTIVSSQDFVVQLQCYDDSLGEENGSCEVLEGCSGKFDGDSMVVDCHCRSWLTRTDPDPPINCPDLSGQWKIEDSFLISEEEGEVALPEEDFCLLFSGEVLTISQKGCVASAFLHYIYPPSWVTFDIDVDGQMDLHCQGCGDIDCTASVQDTTITTQCNCQTDITYQGPVPEEPCPSISGNWEIYWSDPIMDIVSEGSVLPHSEIFCSSGGSSVGITQMGCSVGFFIETEEELYVTFGALLPEGFVVIQQDCGEDQNRDDSSCEFQCFGEITSGNDEAISVDCVCHAEIRRVADSPGPGVTCPDMTGNWQITDAYNLNEEYVAEEGDWLCEMMVGESLEFTQTDCFAMTYIDYTETRNWLAVTVNEDGETTLLCEGCEECSGQITTDGSKITWEVDCNCHTSLVLQSDMSDDGVEEEQNGDVNCFNLQNFEFCEGFAATVTDDGEEGLSFNELDIAIYQSLLNCVEDSETDDFDEAFSECKTNEVEDNILAVLKECFLACQSKSGAGAFKIHHVIAVIFFSLAFLK